MASGIITESGAPKRVIAEKIRTGLQANAITEALIDNLHCLQAKTAAARHAQRLVHGPRLHGS